MSRKPALLILVLVLVAASLLPFRGEAGGRPKGRQKWEYAELYLGNSSGQHHAQWQAGKKLIGSGLVKSPDEALDKIYKGLGGKDKMVSLGVLLDHIGQDGWELVARNRHVYQLGLGFCTFSGARR
jgi:hypothetical protein